MSDPFGFELTLLTLSSLRVKIIERIQKERVGMRKFVENYVSVQEAKEQDTTDRVYSFLKDKIEYRKRSQQLRLSLPRKKRRNQLMKLLKLNPPHLQKNPRKNPRRNPSTPT